MSEEMSSTFKTWSKLVVSHLPGWTFVDSVSPNFCEVHGPDGANFRLFLEHNNKVQVSPSYPTESGTVYPYDAYKKQGSINVTLGRKPEQVAKDIERRFLDIYLAVYQEGKNLLQEHLKFERGCDELAAQFRELVNYPHERSQRREIGWYMMKDGASGLRISVDIRVNSPTSVDLHLRSIPPEVAKDILSRFEQFGGF